MRTDIISPQGQYVRADYADKDVKLYYAPREVRDDIPTHTFIPTYT